MLKLALGTCFVLIVALGVTDTYSLRIGGPELHLGKWSYTNNETQASTWGEHFTQCDGAFESPIDIVKGDTKSASTLKPIRINPDSVDYSQTTYQVINTQHSVQIVFPDNVWRVSLDNTTKGSYCVKQMHFHWGSNDSVGSEHTLDGKRFSLEAHLVTYNCDLYSTYEVASTSPYGHAVLGFWGMEQSNVQSENTLLGKLGQFQTKIAEVLEIGVSVNISPFDLRAVFSLVDPASYYRYMGSLTTPGCTQNVIWTMFTTVAPISKEQLIALRNQNFGTNEEQKKMENNFRPVQQLNSEKTPIPRVVYRASSGLVHANALVLLILHAFRELAQ
ncbi:unnamed protein product [Echinostoma caproni]|uniref:Carbonic anhydrase n=1 Tax=Echinostoma caproni TaxID=27848 RepID=A0A183A9R2_9TREM|nr:unnamed protein product [Echinostoma caproni]